MAFVMAFVLCVFTFAVSSPAEAVASKRSVVAISNKKKTSVKLTAKKKGNATITATVKYIPKGGWRTRTAKLKCKVKSKKVAGVGTKRWIKLCGHHGCESNGRQADGNAGKCECLG